jgi:lipopolysaccharide biosynthesis glycosyltransferase
MLKVRNPPTPAIVVALTVDQSYALGAAVTIASLADHVPKGSDLDIWLLHAGLDDATIGLISRAVARGRGRLHTFKLSPGELALRIRSDYISPATFGRLYLGDILPPECRRVLYLDCDLLVTGDLQDLLNTDLCGRMMAAASEPTLPVDANPRTYERLRDPRLDPAMPYFNAGVLIIDLDIWRRANIGERALRFVAQYGPALMDQDALNAVASGQWLELDPMWNTITYWFRSRSRQQRYQALLRRSRIIHYAGHRKPWLRNDLWEAERWVQYRRQLAAD